MNMKELFVLLLMSHITTPVKHSLKYILTATSGVSNLPEFMGAATVDEVQIGYCDSNIKVAEPKQDWMKKLIKDDPQHLEWYLLKCSETQQVFRANIDGLRQRLNQTGGVHILQKMNGCEWDEETGEVVGFNQYGYDGEDFITLDLQALTWVAPVPQAVITKLRWNTEKARLEHNKYFYIHKCPEWLKKYVKYGRRFLQRTDRPSVSLLQKSSSSPVSCFATGFYPNKAVLFWRKGGDDLHDNVEEGQILPNPDGTFQKSSDLDLSSVRPEDWGKYECVFQLDGLNDDIITKLDQSGIRTNSVPVPPSEFPVGPVVGGVVGLLLLTACICGLLIWRRRVHGYQRGLEVDTELE
uniref:Class I histocompatibility antigen, F10 alpha chain-like n=1 Tax=Echeneis naucrates TaxID=173247 RepID=A0A665U4D7_ECHNA